VRIAGELHQLSIGADTAIELDGKRVFPLPPGDAFGPASNHELVPALPIPVSQRNAEPPAHAGFDYDRLGLREEMEDEPGLEVAPAELGASPDNGGWFFPPDGPTTEQGMATVHGRQQASSFIERAGDRGFGDARAGKPAIEQIALNAGGGEHRIDPERDAAHRIRKPDLLELVANQAHPGALIGIGA